MTDTSAAPEPSMQVVLEESEGFAPRTRKSTAESLSILKPALNSVQENPGKVYTIARGITPSKSASIVSLLNGHYDRNWTFGARTTTDGTAIVQAMYNPDKPRPVRTVERKGGAKKGAARR